MIVGGGIKQGKGGWKKSRVACAHHLGLCSPTSQRYSVQCSRHCLLYAPTSKNRLIFSLFSRRPAEKDAKEVHGHVFVENGLGMCEGVAIER